MTEARPLLIVEDEPDLLRTLEYNFTQAGFVVITAGRGADALYLAQTGAPCLVLLDVMLPDISGWDVCRRLKTDTRTQAIPVVMLTARADEIDRVVGFELGVDDYVTKPFSPRELVLRIRAVLRRMEGVEAQLQIGPFRVDMQSRRADVQGHPLELTALEFRLLHTLMSRKDRVQSRDTLLNDVWGLHVNVETRTVDTHIKRLREKLHGAGDWIQTVRGVGYRFAPPEK